MPEHYEVKRIQSYLKDGGIEGQKIIDLELFPGSEKILKKGSTSQWKEWLVNQKIISIEIKAKYTFIQLSQGTLVWHYRFTGIPHIKGFGYKERLHTIFNLPVLQSSKSHCRFRIYLEDSKILEYLDIRCLSDIRYFSKCQIGELDLFQKLAPDLTSFSPQSFIDWKKSVHLKKRDIKQELQDQFTLPSGIGNYLACEILAHAKLNPWLSLSTISPKQYDALCWGIAEVKRLCEKYTDYRWFRVFKCQNCVTCGKAIIRKKHRLIASSQTTHYCPSCQN